MLRDIQRPKNQIQTNSEILANATKREILHMSERAEKSSLFAWFCAMGVLTSIQYIYLFLFNANAVFYSSNIKSRGMIPVLGVLAIIRLLAVVLVWLMSKTGAIVYFSVSVLFFAYSIFCGLTADYIGIASLLLLSYLVFKNWAAMTWGATLDT